MNTTDTDEPTWREAAWLKAQTENPLSDLPTREPQERRESGMRISWPAVVVGVALVVILIDSVIIQHGF